MPLIRFAKSKPPIDVPAGSNLMKVLLDNSVPVASSCSSEGVCAKCRIKIVEGKENLSRINDTEEFLREAFDIASDERISCQTEVNGDIKIDTRYW